MEERNRETELAERFARCGKVLTAIGDETRQYLITEMMKMGQCGGVRVGAVTEKTNLSRPAVSHHLQILKDAGMLKVRKEGTRNYYYFDSGMECLKELIATLELAVEIAEELPERRERGGAEFPDTRSGESGK